MENSFKCVYMSFHFELGLVFTFSPRRKVQGAPSPEELKDWREGSLQNEN